MGASRFVGRVGGLAVALGVGAAMFSGSGVAFADGADGSDSGGPSADKGSSQSQGPRARRGATRTPGASAATSTVRQQARNDSPPTSAPPRSAVSGGPAEPVANPDPAPASTVDNDAVSPVSVAAPVATEPEAQPTAVVPSAVPAATTAADAVVSDAPVAAPAPVPAPPDAVADVSTAGVGGGTEGAGGSPLLPVASPLSWALMAVARRQPLAAASIGNPPVALVTASEQASNNGVTVDPVVQFEDGILFGDLNATSSRDLELTYTVIGGRNGGVNGSNGGKITLGTYPDFFPTEDQFTLLPYRTWNNAGVGKGTETWQVRVSEVTNFDKFVTGIPLIGGLAQTIIDIMQKMPLISTLLAPIIGGSVVATVTADVAAEAPGETPIAYTYKVTSFDGTLISTNWFPATELADDETAPTVFNGAGLGSPGQTDPYAICGICGSDPKKTAETLGVGSLRGAGFNVVSWDPRGEYDSGGFLNLDNPFFEGRDVSALVDWVAAETPAALNGSNDPKVGMVGGSYGGGIQLVTAATDSRIDAIVPDIAWHSLNQALYPSDAFKTTWGLLLMLDLVTTGARINSQIYNGIFTGALLGWLSESSQALLASSGSTSLLNKLTAPTLLTQGIVDTLFPLNQSIQNAQAIIDNGTTAKLTWFCGGHGVCGDPISDDQANRLRDDSLAWLHQYVAGSGTPADAIPNFQWYDQNGTYGSSTLRPNEMGFNDLAPVTATSTGGHLVIVPILGGSGPGVGPLPVNLTNGSPASNAINIDLTVPEDTQVIGAPTVSFTYSGIGNARAVFAQVVNNTTGRVLGNIVTPIPVKLDGKERPVTIDLNDIVYTHAGDETGELTLQITTSATAFENNKLGFIKISDIEVLLPNRSAA